MGSDFISDAYEQAIAYLYGRINYERTADTAPYPFRLKRMNALLDRLELHGIAGRSIPVIHIAGTKGKGSTANMVAAMLGAAGIRTGLYTSPHLVRLEERFTVDGQLAAESEVVELVASIRNEADRMSSSELGTPTFFEMTTAMALTHFRNRNCQAVVLEVGLGGRLDSTNVCHPAVTAITSIGFDHQHILGNTLGEIAFQKAGIIKPGIPVVIGVTRKEARDVIFQVAEENHARRFAINEQFDCHAVTTTKQDPSDDNPTTDEWCTTFDLHSHDAVIQSREHWMVPLDGAHQARNAAIACVIMDLLGSVLDVPIERQQAGLSQLRMAGRVERFSIGKKIDIILDTSHNDDSIAGLCECIARRADGRPITVVFGTSRDKEHRPMLSRLCAEADHVILTRYHGNPRFRDTAELFRDLPSGAQATTQDQPLEAVQMAIDRVKGPHLIVVCGSFFLAAEVRAMLQQLAINRGKS